MGGVVVLPYLPGKKRLDLAGVLIGSLFKQLFNNLCKDVKRYLRSCLSENKAFNITQVRDPPPP